MQFKKSLMLMLLVSSILVFIGLGFIYKYVFKNSVSLSELLAIRPYCSQASKLAIEQRRLDEPRNCAERHYNDGGKRIVFTEISYGEPQDCPAGCFFAQYSGIVVDGKVVDFPSLRKDILETEIHNRIAQVCDLKQSYKTSIIRSGMDYKWRIDLKSSDQECSLDGFVLVDVNENYDFSQLISNTSKIDCNDSEVAKRICLQNQSVRSGSCEGDERVKNVCLYYRADSERMVSVCDEINSDEELIDLCYYTVAVKLKDPNICKLRDLSYYYKHNCETETQYAN